MFFLILDNEEAVNGGHAVQELDASVGAEFAKQRAALRPLHKAERDKVPDELRRRTSAAPSQLPRLGGERESSQGRIRVQNEIRPILEAVLASVDYLQSSIIYLLSYSSYKMISQYTWPNFRGGSDREGTKIIIDECQHSKDVKYGHTKIFIRSPRTLFSLENYRNDLLPGIVILIQKTWRGRG